MIYTPEEKKRMDALLHAFRDYIDAQNDYDVVYSRKAGFLRICVGENSDQIYFPITGFDDMIQMFVDDFLLDEENRVGHNLHRDYDHVRSQLIPLLEGLKEDRAHALHMMEQGLDACKRRCEQMRQDRLAMIRETEELLEALKASIVP